MSEYIPSKRRLVWVNGAQMTTFPANERLHGHPEAGIWVEGLWRRLIREGRLPGPARTPSEGYDRGMDSTGKIHDMNPEHLQALDRMTLEDLTPIPEKMIGRVTYLPGAQKRAWRALVRSGVDAEAALLQVQQVAPGEMLDFVRAVGRSK